MSNENPTAVASSEDMLRAVIDAQIRGGYSGYDGMEVSHVEPNGHIKVQGEYWHILEILLDTQGCKAAYGGDYPESWSTILDTAPPFWIPASFKILKAWHSGEGNNVHAAIQTAYSLLHR